jgi:peptidoglycan-associated lipoprotein
VESVPTPRAGAGQATAPAEASPLKDVFFDYDNATIPDDQKAAISADVAWLQAHPGTKVVVEGHCDERGSEEYNLGLGERRAQTVKAFLVAAGIATDRISTVSYGKERPFVLGHDEKDWKWNRRAHLDVQGK